MREDNFYCRLHVKSCSDVRSLLVREINTTYYFMKDMDYERKRKLCDVPTSRLCSALVYCKTMPVLPASIRRLLVQYAVVVGGCVFLSQHFFNALTIVTVTVINVTVNVIKCKWKQTWRLHDKGAL